MRTHDDNVCFWSGTKACGSGGSGGSCGLYFFDVTKNKIGIHFFFIDYLI